MDTIPRTTFGMVILDVHPMYKYFYDKYVPASEYYSHSTAQELSNIYDSLLYEAIHGAILKHSIKNEEPEIPYFQFPTVTRSLIKNCDLAHKDVMPVFQSFLDGVWSNLSVKVKEEDIVKCLSMGSTLIVGVQNCI